MLLTDYIQNLRDTLRDQNGAFYSTPLLTRCINRARKKVAREGQCIRYMPPSTGSVASVAVSSGGSGYTTATATISEPDGYGSYSTATVSVTVAGGQVTAIPVISAGSGYVDTPTVTIEGDGTGAAGVVTLTPHMVAAADREAYTADEVATIGQALRPGLGKVLGIVGISVSWGAQKPTLGYIDFLGMQAYLRSYAAILQGPPAVWSMYADQGEFYIYPKSPQVAQMDVDAYWSVIDLSGTTYPDLIPEVWTEAVNFYAAKLAYMNAQRADDARTMQAEYDDALLRARGSVAPVRIPSFYGVG